MTAPILVSSDSDALLRYLPVGEPSRNTFAGLVFVLTTSGHATVCIDGHSYTLQRGALLTLLPSHLLSTTGYDSQFDCLILAFQFDYMSDFPYMLPSYISDKIVQTPLIGLHAEEFDKLENWHRSIMSHYHQTAHSSYQEILRSLLFVFTAEVNAIYSDKPTKPATVRHEELTDGFFKLLHCYFRSQREASFYAGELCISSKHLSKIISQVTGYAPSYWIADFTVREAKMLLKSTSLTVSQLSDQLNFANSSFFARYFKRHTGSTPVEYRLKKEC